MEVSYPTDRKILLNRSSRGKVFEEPVSIRAITDCATSALRRKLRLGQVLLFADLLHHYSELLFFDVLIHFCPKSRIFVFPLRDPAVSEIVSVFSVELN